VTNIVMARFSLHVPELDPGTGAGDPDGQPALGSASGFIEPSHPPTAPSAVITGLVPVISMARGASLVRSGWLGQGRP
jgi:hypothetical protein